MDLQQVSLYNSVLLPSPHFYFLFLKAITIFNAVFEADDRLGGWVRTPGVILRNNRTLFWFENTTQLLTVNCNCPGLAQRSRGVTPWLKDGAPWEISCYKTGLFQICKQQHPSENRAELPPAPQQQCSEAPLTDLSILRNEIIPRNNNTPRASSSPRLEASKDTNAALTKKPNINNWRFTLKNRRFHWNCRAKILRLHQPPTIRVQLLPDVPFCPIPSSWGHPILLLAWNF